MQDSFSSGEEYSDLVAHYFDKGLLQKYGFFEH
jgi:hypothetical protein